MDSTLNARRDAFTKFLNRQDDGPLAPLFEPIKPELLNELAAESAVGDLHLAERTLNGGYLGRRRAESAVAHYIETQIADRVPTAYDEVKRQEKMENLVHSMRRCRREGAWGTLDGRLVIVWKHKCGCLHLCPDEAREEQQRLQGRYPPVIESLIQTRGLRPYKLTISPPNFPAGHLAWAQRQLYRQWFRFRRCREFKNIKGALCTLEAPLSRHGDWNVHLNVLLLCEGELDYKAVRSWWKCQVEIDDWLSMRSKTKAKLRARGVDPNNLTNAEVLHAALEEIVKYPVQTVPEKAAASRVPDAGAAGGWCPDSGLYRDGAGKIATPPLTSWPADRFIEWFEAQRRFRRTRSYGVLYRLPEPEEKGIELEEFKKRFQRRGFVRYNGARYLISLHGAVDLIPKWGITRQRRRDENDSTGPPGPDRKALIAQVMASARHHWANNLSYSSNF